jgi:hypothetical protein
VRQSCGKQRKKEQQIKEEREKPIWFLWIGSTPEGAYLNHCKHFAVTKNEQH